MSSKTFQEVFDEIKANVSLSKKKKPIKSFSRADFNRLATAFLNEEGYSVNTVSTKDGDMVEKEVTPIKDFRNMLRVILIDFGVDTQEAQRILDGYDIHNVDGLYEVCSELLFQYIAAGKKFDFLPKADFIGSISLKDIGESVGTFRDIKDKETIITVQKKAHHLLEKRSKCPNWLKTRV